MYDPPVYLWVITIALITGIGASTCFVLYTGAERAGLGRGRAALMAGAAALLFGGWFTATALIAEQGWYHRPLSHGPWMPLAVVGFLGVLLALSRVPVVARALSAPGMASRLLLPHSFRMEGVVFLIYLSLGHLPALFALPAGLGDITTSICAPLAAHRLARGAGRKAALWVNVFGVTDLVVALALGAVTGFGLTSITPSGAPISELPLVLVPTFGVPLLLTLHITSIVGLVRAPRPAPRAGQAALEATL